MPFKLQNCWATGCLRKAELLTGLLKGFISPFFCKDTLTIACLWINWLKLIDAFYIEPLNLQSRYK